MLRSLITFLYHLSSNFQAETFNIKRTFLRLPPFYILNIFSFVAYQYLYIWCVSSGPYAGSDLNFILPLPVYLFI